MDADVQAKLDEFDAKLNELHERLTMVERGYMTRRSPAEQPSTPEPKDDDEPAH